MFGARAAALDERDALLGSLGGDAENLGDLRVGGVAARGARAGGGGAGHQSARVVAAAGESAASTVGAGKGGGDEADARVFAHGEILVRDRERDGRHGAYGGDDKSCYKNGIHGIGSKS